MIVEMGDRWGYCQKFKDLDIATTKKCKGHAEDSNVEERDDFFQLSVGTNNNKLSVALTTAHSSG